ncbi:plasmid replication initiator RepA [Erwiniaceae bacterium L1_54_6]|uniref:plasmid replication initiator RepA n=1 Tax=Pantoea sp. (strain At-9b) TaxID=592316 RepID=UPI0001F25F97|nr:plasmid replication initiator RepA [Pantoea sp. At-9b]ADU73078.1 replication initiation protein [Pantoea sp. At-9b]MDF7662755.1 plasmid replication initiator RepA [Erwiniaceae bacterium L1_54_6]
MNDQILIGLNGPNLKKDGRRRGDHSVVCKCSNPEWFAPANFRRLPGQMGHAMSRLVMKNKRTGKMVLRQRMSRHPYFVQLRDAAGRKRDFRPEKQALYDAIWPLLIQRADLATSVVTFNCSKLADELSPRDENGKVIPETRVEPSRLSRLFEEWERFGLTERPDLETDPVTGYCMPRHIVLTDRFWQLCGIDMDKFLAERNARLAAEADGITEPGTHDSVRAARRRWYENMRMATLLSRREKASKLKRRKRLSKLPIDDRRNAMARLLRARPAHEWMHLPPEEFDRQVWNRLRQLDLGLDYEASPHPIPDIVH